MILISIMGRGLCGLPIVQTAKATVCDGVIGIVCSATGDSSGAGANPFHLNLCNGIDVDVLAIAQRDFCQIRANVSNPDCMSGDLSRPTAAAALASVNIGTATDVPSIPTPDTPSAEVHNEFLKGTDTGLNTNGYLKNERCGGRGSRYQYGRCRI